MNTLLQRRMLKLLSVAIIPAGLAETSLGAERTFNQSTGSWFTSSNWSSNTIPTELDTVYIGTTTGNRSATIIEGTAEADFVTLGHWASGSAGGSGSLTVGSLGILYTSYLDVGGSRNGTLTVESGGIVNTGGLATATSDDVSGNLTITGAGSKLSVNSADDVLIGFAGNSTVLIQNGGTFENTEGGGDTVIGYLTSASTDAVVTVTGVGSTLAAANLKVGGFGRGSLTISNGAHVSSTSGDVAYGSTNDDGATQGRVLLSGSGSQWTIADQLTMGHHDGDSYYNTSSVTITEGATLTTGNGVVLSGSATTLNIGDGGLAGKLESDVKFGYDNIAASLNFDHSDDITYAYNIIDEADDSGKGFVTKSGIGTTTLSGNSDYRGGTFIYGGTLRATHASALGSGTVHLSGGNLEIANNSSLNVGRNLLITASGTISANRLNSGANAQHTLGTLTLGGQTLSIVRGSLVTGTASITSGTTRLTAHDSVFDIGEGAFLTLGALTGSYRFEKKGAGQLTLGTASTRNAATTLSEGTLRLQVANALGSSSSATLSLKGGTLELRSDTATTFNGTVITVEGNATIQASRPTTGIALTHTIRGLALEQDSILTIAHGSSFNTNNSGSINTGTVTLKGNATVILSNTNGTGIGVTTFGAINDQGTGRTLTKSGPGTLTLSAAATQVSDGTILKITGGQVNSNNATALGTLAQIELSANTTLNLRSSQTFAALNGSGGSVTLDSNSVTIGTTTNRESSFGGTISGSGGLIKSGTGTLILSGNNTYTGSTQINQGRLQLDGTLTSTSISLANGAKLGGNGSFAAAAAIQGTYAPGNSIGTLSSGSLDFANTGVLEWGISDAIGEAGTGWDYANVTGGISFVTGAAVRLVTLSLQNFDANNNYSWDIATTTTGITGLETVTLQIGDLQAFYDGTFSLRVENNKLLVDYTAVPESSTVVLLLAATALSYAATRRPLLRSGKR